MARIMNYLVLMALLAKVVTAEVYEESNPHLIRENDVKTSFKGLNDLGTDTYWRQNVLLYKLFNNLKQHSTNDRNTPEDETWPEMDAKETIVKKWLNVFNGLSWPQRKWKIKGKGPTLCYLKLCAFRLYP